ncbi:hypothetical protein AUJ64_02245 [Candidatus Pacearchaeota archaeon CG1_02_39_14]|nr:MAG: hypothetical protein AUJ64_02245 [Candidatus Pacearchaeota archaeon CG1_02_39_14]
MSGKREEIERKVSELDRMIRLLEQAKREKKTKAEEIHSKYKRGEITYGNYIGSLSVLLENKTIEEWMDHYNRQVLKYKNYSDFYNYKLGKIKENKGEQRQFKFNLKVLPIAIAFLLIASFALIFFALFPFQRDVVSLAPEEIFSENCQEMSEWQGAWSVMNLLGDNRCATNLNSCGTGCAKDMGRQVISPTGTYTSVYVNLTYVIANAPATSNVTLYVGNGTDERIFATLPGNGGTNSRLNRIFVLHNVISFSDRIILRFSCQAISNGGTCAVDDIQLIADDGFVPDLRVNITSPEPATYTASDLPMLFNITLNHNGLTVNYTLNGGANNFTMSTGNNLEYTAYHPFLTTGNHEFRIYAWDNEGGYNNTEKINFFFNASLIDMCSTINYSGTFYLNQSINAQGTCLNFLADNVILDGSGFTITGDNSPGSVGVNLSKMSVYNLTLRNIDILNFATTVGSSVGSAIGQDAGNIILVNSNVEEIIAFGEPSGGGNGGNVSLYNSSASLIDVHGGDAANFEIPPGSAGNIYIENDFINITNSGLNLAPGYNTLGFGRTGLLTLNYTYGFEDLGTTSYGTKLLLEISNKSVGGGIIRWINQLTPNPLTFRNIGGNSEISRNYAYVNPAGSLAILNSPANVTLSDMPGSFQDPEVKKDGLSCQNCRNHTSLNAQTVRFNVTGFSEYSIAERSFANQNPVVVDISNIGNQDIVPAGLKRLTFSVIASDGNGWQDITNVNAGGRPPSDPLQRENSTCLFVNSLSQTEANYSCSIDIWYFDEPGTWLLGARAEDNQGAISPIHAENFVLNGMFYVVHNSGIGWDSLAPGSQNNLASTSMLLNNSGNLDISLIHINSSHLIGLSDPNYFIPAGGFSVNVLNQCEGNGLIEGENILIAEASIPRGNNSINTGQGNAGQETLWYCAEDVPSPLPSQVYSTSGQGTFPWEIIFALVVGWINIIFVVPVSIRKEDLKKAISSLSNEEILEILKSRLNEKPELLVPISIFRSKLSPAEALCRYLKDEGKRFSEIAKLIGRDQRTVWNNYMNSRKKVKVKLKTEEGEGVPVGIFADNRLSVLESVVFYLKKAGRKNNEIAEVLGRDSKNVWTLNSRAQKKKRNKLH